MSQGHSLLAALWNELERRNDTANILRELVGQNTLELLLLDRASVASMFNAIRPLHWIKTIFDLQRAYHQASAHCNVPGLLPADLIYSTLLHILRVKSCIFPAEQQIASWSGQRLLLIHTFLSGFRLLKLLSAGVSPQRITFLLDLWNSTWKDHDDLNECEKFIILELMPQALDNRVPADLQSGHGYAFNLRQLGVPTFPEGLYPLCIRPPKLIVSAFSGICKAGSPWLTWYWTLFDTIWATEAALIQYYVDHGSIGSAFDSPIVARSNQVDVLIQLQNGRRNLLSAVFNQGCKPVNAPSSYLIESLEATVVEWWLDTGGVSSADRIISEKQALELRYWIDSFRIWIRERSVQVGPTMACSGCGPAPLVQLALTCHGSERSNSIFFTANTLDQFPASPGGAIAPIANPMIVDGTLDTPSSSDGASVTPTTTSGSISSSSGGGTLRPTSPLSEQALTPSTTISSQLMQLSRSLSDGNMTVASSAGKMRRAKTFRNPLKVSKEKAVRLRDACQPSSYCFSSSGRHILLHGGNVGGFMKIAVFTDPDEEAEPARRYRLEAVKQVAAGTNRCAALASHQDRFKIVIFQSGKPRPEAQIDVNIALRHHTECCLAVSANDRLAALAIAGHGVQLYALTNGHVRQLRIYDQLHLYQHLAAQRRGTPGHVPGVLSSREAAQEAASRSSVVEQKLSFSPAGDRLIVATQLADKHVYVDVFKTDEEPCSTLTPQPTTFSLPPFTANDGGLTDVLYNDTNHQALVFAMLGKDYPSLIDFTSSETSTPRNSSFATRVVTAAQSRDGSVLLANGLNELLLLKYDRSGDINTERLKKCAQKLHPTIFKPGAIMLSHPAHGTGFAFWIKDGKLMLRRMTFGANESITDVDLRPLVDQLHAEQTEPILLSSTAPAGLGDHYSLRSLVELPGSLRTIAELAADEKGLAK